MKWKKGFSLTEMLVAVLILAILLAVGVPAMSSAWAETRLENFVQVLNISIQRARYLSASENASYCVGYIPALGNTQFGLWRDENYNAVYDSGNAVEKNSLLVFGIPSDVDIDQGNVLFGIRMGQEKILMFMSDGRLTEPDDPEDQLKLDPLDGVYRSFIKFETSNLVAKTFGRGVFITRTGEMKIEAYEN